MDLNTLQNKKILITGASGQLAKELANNLARSQILFVAPAENDCDITNSKTMNDTINRSGADIIINYAADNQVDLAEENRETVFAVNTRAVENLASICKDNNLTLVHFSSDYVFDGEKSDLYTEADEPNPLNVYGESKRAGEESLIRINPHFLIFRLRWVVGPGQQNFIFKLNQLALKNHVLKITADECSVPTFANTIVDITLQSLSKGLTGLYHLTNSGYASRYELSRQYLKETKKENIIVPVPLGYFPTKAKRPRFSAMSNKKLQNALNTVIPHWEKDLKRYCQLNPS